MTQERKTRLVARGGVLLSAALWLLHRSCRSAGSTHSGTGEHRSAHDHRYSPCRRDVDRTERHLGKQSDNVPVPLAAL